MELSAETKRFGLDDAFAYFALLLENPYMALLANSKTINAKPPTFFKDRQLADNHITLTTLLSV